MLVSLHTGKNNVEASAGSSLWAADMPCRVVIQVTRAGYFSQVVQIKMTIGTIIRNYLLLPFPLHSFLSSFPPLVLPSLFPLLSLSEEYTCQMFSPFFFHLLVSWLNVPLVISNFLAIFLNLVFAYLIHVYNVFCSYLSTTAYLQFSLVLPNPSFSQLHVLCC